MQAHAVLKPIVMWFVDDVKTSSKRKSDNKPDIVSQTTLAR